MPEPTNTFYQACRPPPPPAVQPNRPHFRWRHPRSRLWKTWNVDDVAPRPPLPRKRTSGRSWIDDLPDFGVTKLNKVKSIAAGLTGKTDEAWLSKESLIPIPISELVGEPKPEEEGNKSENLAVLNSSKVWTEEGKENATNSDPKVADSPIPNMALPQTIKTEQLQTASLDYGMTEPPDISNPDTSSSWGEINISDSSNQGPDMFLPDPISSESSSSDDWWSGDGDAKSLQEFVLSSTFYPLEQGIHIHFPSWREITRPSQLWSPRYYNNLFFYRAKLSICFCEGRGRRY